MNDKPKKNKSNNSSFYDDVYSTSSQVNHDYKKKISISTNTINFTSTEKIKTKNYEDSGFSSDNSSILRGITERNSDELKQRKRNMSIKNLTVNTDNSTFFNSSQKSENNSNLEIIKDKNIPKLNLVLHNKKTSVNLNKSKNKKILFDLPPIDENYKGSSSYSSMSPKNESKSSDKEENEINQKIIKELSIDVLKEKIKNSSRRNNESFNSSNIKKNDNDSFKENEKKSTKEEEIYETLSNNSITSYDQFLSNADNKKSNKSNKKIFASRNSLPSVRISVTDPLMLEIKEKVGIKNVRFLKYKTRQIPIKTRNIMYSKNRYLKTLIELQIFKENSENSTIWVMKFNKKCKYLAVGMKNGCITIYETILNFNTIYDNEDELKYFSFIDETPKKKLKNHTSDIIDLCWSNYYSDLLLSASLDYKVILWDISLENNCFISEYKHTDIVTCVKFSPSDPSIFATGCLDKYVRIYKIDQYFLKTKEKKDDTTRSKKKYLYENFKISQKNNEEEKAIEYFNIVDKITSISFYPDGSQIAVGTYDGKILIYNIIHKKYNYINSFRNSTYIQEYKATYNKNFTCRNRLGKNCLGKKVTNIDFINRNVAIITTCDSRIRKISMIDGKMINKYKGLVNEDSMIRASSDLCNDVIISGSEDGCVYVWSINNKENDERKNYHYEYFKPFSQDIVECCAVVDDVGMTNYIRKIAMINDNIYINSIFLLGTDNGRIQVLMNIDD